MFSNGGTIGKDMVSVKKKDKIVLPAYSENIKFLYLKDVEPKGESN